MGRDWEILELGNWEIERTITNFPISQFQNFPILNYHHPILPILLLPLHLYFFGNKGVNGLSGVVGLYGEFAVEAAVDQHTERYFGRAAEIEQGIEGSADGAAGVQHIIDQHHFPVLYAEGYIRAVGNMQAGAYIIPVESNVQLAVPDTLRVGDPAEFVYDTVAQEYAPGL